MSASNLDTNFLSSGSGAQGTEEPESVAGPRRTMVCKCVNVVNAGIQVHFSGCGVTCKYP